MAPFPAEGFVNAMAALTIPGYTNPWSSDQNSWLRRQNLITHLKTPNPRYLFVSDRGINEDVMVTGVPLCCEYAVQSGTPPGVRQLAYSRSTPTYSADAAVLWKHLASLGIAARSLCFSASPFIPAIDVPPRDELRWVSNIALWFTHITVITLSRETRDNLRSNGVDARFLLPPRSPGFSGLLAALIASEKA